MVERADLRGRSVVA